MVQKFVVKDPYEAIGHITGSASKSTSQPASVDSQSLDHLFPAFTMDLLDRPSPPPPRFPPLGQMRARISHPDSHPMKLTGNALVHARYSSTPSSPTVFTPSLDLEHHDHDKGGPASGDDDLANQHVKTDPVKQDPVQQHPAPYGPPNACAGYGDEISFDDLDTLVENFPSTSLPMNSGMCVVIVNALRPRADSYMSRLLFEGLPLARGPARVGNPAFSHRSLQSPSCRSFLL